MKFSSLFIIFQLLIYSTTSSQTAENKLIDDWHKNASNAKLNDYFSATSDNFVFLGTAPGERWSKSEFYTFCKPHFDAGRAWDFKASNRIWTFSEDKKTAWFDEDLSTWMEGCRGSGIIVKQNNVWKIAYYNLTVLIENEKINQFINLRKL